MIIDEQLLMVGQVLLSLLLGVLLGTERSFAGKRAGMRTFGLVAMGSCLLVIISTSVSSEFVNITNFDPLRVAAGVIMGIGFLAGGAIFVDKDKAGLTVNGLTTAAGLWIASAIGMAVGFEMYMIAILTTFITIFTFTILLKIENRIRPMHNDS